METVDQAGVVPQIVDHFDWITARRFVEQEINPQTRKYLTEDQAKSLKALRDRAYQSIIWQRLIRVIQALTSCIALEGINFNPKPVDLKKWATSSAAYLPTTIDLSFCEADDITFFGANPGTSGLLGKKIKEYQKQYVRGLLRKKENVLWALDEISLRPYAEDPLMDIADSDEHQFSEEYEEFFENFRINRLELFSKKNAKPLADEAFSYLLSGLSTAYDYLHDETEPDTWLIEEIVDLSSRLGALSQWHIGGRNSLLESATKAKLNEKFIKFAKALLLAERNKDPLKPHWQMQFKTGAASTLSRHEKGWESLSKDLQKQYLFTAEKLLTEEEQEQARKDRTKQEHVGQEIRSRLSN